MVPKALSPVARVRQVTFYFLPTNHRRRRHRLQFPPLLLRPPLLPPPPLPPPPLPLPSPPPPPPPLSPPSCGCLSFFNRGICFETEGDLRARGAYRTPDARLLVPVAVRSAETCKWHVVNWIDSKAMFGDPETFRRDHFAQLVSYVNRYGPGMVIYWLDLAESLNGEATPPQHRHADILAVAAFPDVVALPEDEPPGAWDAAMERWAA
ncbi:unnamed protein product [Phaeothamnion confervicola]